MKKTAKILVVANSFKTVNILLQWFMRSKWGSNERNTIVSRNKTLDLQIIGIKHSL